MFGNKKKLNLLEQTQANLIKSQENLEITQKNIENFFDIKESKPLEVQLLKNENDEQKPLEVLVRKAPDYIPKKEDDEKWRAAYALNLCTVSVSQIVEYDDIRTLDQEYSTILNNLNLQNMPKDEALLDILKQLLNVITFFKIQEGDKEMLEKEYQHKMKNAIWNAVPNMSVILTTPDPKVMLFNLATQVGIGYMNYRKEKANTQLEQDKQKWQLKRSAMEQINGLRRELFDTAWRLSKEYKFDDHLRLSEHQIEQYNKILLDNNPARKYERLLSIQKTFKAYPPFWYYLGHTATEIGKTPEAIGSFYEFLRLTGNKTINRQNVSENSNLLREDHLCASCALELAGLVSDDRKEMSKLLDIAVETSGKSLDVLQMCAMTYISIKEKEKAIQLLRYLVNEGYNIDVNANSLSKLYFEQMLLNKVDAYGNYKELKDRDDVKNYMIDFQPVISEQEKEKIFSNYILERRDELYRKSRFVFNVFTQQIEDEFFNISYLEGSIEKEFSDFLERIYIRVNDFFNGIDKREHSSFETIVLDAVGNFDKEKLYKFINGDRTNVIIKNVCKELVFRKILSIFNDTLTTTLQSIDNELIFKLSYALDSFCLQNKLPLFSTTYTFDNKKCFQEKLKEKIYSKQELKDKQEKESNLKICLDIIAKYKEKLVINKNNEKVYFAIRGDEKFNKYMNDWEKELSNYILDKDEIVIAVLNDRHFFQDQDLIFTTNGYFLYSTYIKKSTSKDNKMLYSNELEKGEENNSLKIKNLEYCVSGVNTSEIRSMVREIDNKLNIQNKI